MLSAVEKTRRFCAAQVRRILGDSVVQKDNKSATEKGCGIGISKESGRATGRDPSDLGLKKGKAVVREHSKALGNRERFSDPGRAGGRAGGRVAWSLIDWASGQGKAALPEKEGREGGGEEETRGGEERSAGGKERERASAGERGKGGKRGEKEDSRGQQHLV
ncbi:hypothetical protein AXG93_2727s1080 [Marchantia polymorpha subsp. ruderalis]|uniref:Uncharacterized protein n=1 Tax=Marchantia polymorpha subsp. ruderalis TaxID=1480154 RepID=A0A176VD88_MARPO|nr:hypothetical protein AXG93_2727s1080 [Marchantia polymorpha subsp. ruderalis]